MAWLQPPNVSREATPDNNTGLRWDHSKAGQVCAAICILRKDFTNLGRTNYGDARRLHIRFRPRVLLNHRDKFAAPKPEAIECTVHRSRAYE